MSDPSLLSEASEKLAMARKALVCLYIAVEADVAKDIGEKVEGAFRALLDHLDQQDRHLAQLQQERKPAFACDYARMWDLVRHQRSELEEAGLITLEEYAGLVAEETKDRPGQGSPSPRRLESYDELRRKLDRIESQLAQLRAERAWQPIETAPKDGTRIVAWVPFQNDLRPGVWCPASWTDDRYSRRPAARWDVESPFGRKWGRHHQPTHWMPLPLAPKGPADPVQQPRSDADSSK